MGLANDVWMEDVRDGCLEMVASITMSTVAGLCAMLKEDTTGDSWELRSLPAHHNDIVPKLH